MGSNDRGSRTWRRLIFPKGTPAMSTLVTTQFFAKPGRGGDVADLLIKILGESNYDELYFGQGTAARESAF
jgi:hypothetical protein